jgi:hypothetical protein
VRTGANIWFLSPRPTARFAEGGLPVESNLPHALEYLKAGLSVIPCGPDKKPLIPSWLPYQQKRASEDEVRAWWTNSPNAMIGIVTGEISGIAVIDIDTPEGLAGIKEYLPDGLLTPCAETPRGGMHLYFKTNGDDLRNNAGAIPGVDFRANGGYVVASPSVNGSGKAYRWKKGMELGAVPLSPLPDAYISLLKKSLYNRGVVNSENPKTTNDHKDHTKPQLFVDGTRDEDLFHVANCLVKGGCETDVTSQVLEILAQNCEPPFPEKEIAIKIKSALERAARRERNITEEIREWVLTTGGHFLTTDYHKDLDLTTRDHKKAGNMAILRLVDEGLIERYGSKRGCYRLIEKDVEIIDFLNAPDQEFPIDLPFGLSSLLRLFPGNVGIFAGAKSSGKTAIAFDIIKLNQHRYEIVYLNSEMHDVEMRDRLKLHGDIRLTDWRFTAIRRGHDWADLITPEKKIFIIDYMENVDGDAWRIGAEIKKIHDKLKDGVAIIFLQKKAGDDLARGGQYTLDKARFYVALDKGKAKIIDAKAFRVDNPNGKTLNFKIVQGSKILPQGTWED